VEGQDGYYGAGYKLLAELRVKYEDGSSEVIPTDDSWEVTRSKITFSNIYDGEHRDDTLPDVTPVKAEILGTADLFPVKERLSLPVIVQEEVPAIALLDTPAGEKVFDMGQNLTGVFSLHLKEEAGTRIHIQVGEVLQQGNFYRDNLRTARAEYWYVSDGTEMDLIPEFTFYGYRYVKVEGAKNLKKEDMKALVCYSDITPAGKMVTGDQMLNKLLSNIAWGQKGNFVDVPTDCPQRDERMGWTADTQVFVPTACFMTDSYAFYRKYLYELRGEQKLADGAVPDVIPSHGVGGGSSVWGDAATIMPWMLYEYYGDKQILIESYDSMKAWVDHIRRVDQGEQRCWKDVFQYGDWLALDNVNGVKDSVKGGTDDAFIGYVYYMNSAALVKEAAKLLGKENDAKEYAELEKELRDYIQEEYYTPSGRCAVPTQTAYTLTLMHGLSCNEEKTLGLLKKVIKEAGTKLRTGFVGTPMVASVLSKYNEDKLAYTILHDEEYPGWLYEINLGATTVWERWNSMEADGSVSSTGMNSFNHYAYGSIGEWMFKTMGGISPDLEKPGFKRAIIRPIPDYRTG
ncbi:MAG: family 78 glycoside hydrolase catalytic domain, partial [Lachnospiraceae bacterium]|nr:family 78 glycoside hydrolase catalytic domain [Lachnospiraceae bacterium]